MATDRAPLVERLVAEGVRCEVCLALAEVGASIGCTGRVEGLHERRKRSAAGSLTIGANLIPACNRGNGFVEDSPGLARELLGSWLVVREGDPEWPELGVRAEGPPLEVAWCARCGQAYAHPLPSGTLPCGHPCA